MEGVTSVAINAFIVFYLFWMWSWDLPHDSFLKRLNSKISFLPQFLGLSHSWSLFAPIPINTNRQLTIRIDCEGGEVVEWNAECDPHGGKAGLASSMRNYKLEHNLIADGDKSLSREVAKFHIRKCKSAGISPKIVTFILEDTPIQIPGYKMISSSRMKIFEYRPNPNDY